MADSGSGNCNGNNNRNNLDEGEQNDDNEDASSPPDIGLGHHEQIGHQNLRECSSGAGCGSETTRREENPVFSFKHFLSGSGSRPKQVYQSMSPPASPNPRHPEVIGGANSQSHHMLHSSPAPRMHEVTSGLPDFVQDHLVIEQCYLNSNSQQPMSVDLDHLPDFTGHDGYDGGYCRPAGGQDTSLPDFLSDGPIRSERRDSDSPPLSPQTPADLRHSPRFQIENERLRLENDRLRRELDAMRRQISDQIARNESLETDLCMFRNRDPPDVDMLLKQLKQAEDSLKRVNKRALMSENRAEKLKQEVQTLRNELEAMRCLEGAASTSALQTDSERLASQLRNAANTAELSLRNLLIGVDNLRHLAASIASQPTQSSGSRRRGNPAMHGPSSSRATLDSSDESLDEDPNSPTGPAL